MGGMAANMAPSMPRNYPDVQRLDQSLVRKCCLTPSSRLVRALAIRSPYYLIPTLPVAVPVQQPVADDSVVTNTTFTSAPAAAADGDLIEKEWVDQAKKVINTTKDNPHEQARLVSELMRDYVRKRYGKEVGKAPDNL